MCGEKKFNGKWFGGIGSKKTKAEAQKLAQKLRDMGNLARIVKGKSATGNVRYYVYARNKGAVRRQLKTSIK